jgi:hypothetical protein
MTCPGGAEAMLMDAKRWPVRTSGSGLVAHPARSSA